MRVVIVGGGTSGWMTASYLAKAFGETTEITVVESASIRTIGVGEATFSTIKLFFDYLGLDERDWMPHCSASYKLAIRFAGWTRSGGHFYHPFERYRSASGHSAAEWWMKLRPQAAPFDQACFVVPSLCEAMRSPRFLDGRVYDQSVGAYFGETLDVPNTVIADHQVQYPYGYHFNASELANFLQSYGMKRGVRRVVDDVLSVNLKEDGSIASVQTREHGAVEGDLFVDCTGFRGLLINKALEEPFMSFNDTLLNDSAVAIQVPRDIERDGMRPYTTAQAMSTGWSWNIPLYGRDGTGYVYCSKYLDAEGAEREFRRFLGPASDGCEANHIKMRVGRCRNSWVKNCVAIGLSSGFVEPLESTGIFFIQHGIEELVRNFPRADRIDPLLRAAYNRVVGQCIDGVREFLTIHYCVSDRDDTEFWRETKKVPLPESLRQRLELWQSKLPCARTIYEYFHGFEAYSWSTMLLGLNARPDAHLPVLDRLDPTAAMAMFAGVRTDAELLVKTLPSQHEYLTQLRASAAGKGLKPRPTMAEV